MRKQPDGQVAVRLILWGLSMAKKTVSYIAPPKLQSRFLLVGLTVPELAIMLGLFFSQVFWGQIIYAIFLPLAFAVFVVRFIDDKSIKDILMIMLRYHFCPQQFTQHVTEQKKIGTSKK